MALAGHHHVLVRGRAPAGPAGRGSGAASAASAAQGVAWSSLPPKAPPSRVTSTSMAFMGRPSTRADDALDRGRAPGWRSGSAAGRLLAGWPGRPGSPGRGAPGRRTRRGPRRPCAQSSQAASTSPRRRSADGDDELSRRPRPRGDRGPPAAPRSRARSWPRRRGPRAVSRPPRAPRAGPRSATAPSASSGSSGTMPPIWFSPGMSAAVRAPRRPRVARRRPRCRAGRCVPWATGEARTAAWSRPGGIGQIVDEASLAAHVQGDLVVAHAEAPPAHSDSRPKRTLKWARTSWPSSNRLYSAEPRTSVIGEISDRAIRRGVDRASCDPARAPARRPVRGFKPHRNRADAAGRDPCAER